MSSLPRVSPLAIGLALALTTASACGGGGNDDGNGGADDDLAFCVAENNRYRAMVVPNSPFTRSAELEAYAAVGAKQDGDAHTPHGHFKATKGGGVASAENMIPWWKLSRYGSVQEVLKQGIALMFAEGPGDDFAKHGHYLNIVGNYTKLGCGIYLNGDEVTVAMDFR